MSHTEVHIAGATREGCVRDCGPKERHGGRCSQVTVGARLVSLSGSRCMAGLSPVVIRPDWSDQEACVLSPCVGFCAIVTAEAPISCSSGTETRMAPCPRYRDITTPFKMYIDSSCTKKGDFFLHFCDTRGLEPIYMEVLLSATEHSSSCL
jgi:hypothetical protein